MRHSCNKRFPCEIPKVSSLKHSNMHKTVQATFKLQKLRKLLFTMLPSIVHSMSYALQSSQNTSKLKTSQLRALRHERYCSQNSCSAYIWLSSDLATNVVRPYTFTPPFEVKCQHHSAAWDSPNASSSNTSCRN